jgi:hypothetical protein
MPINFSDRAADCESVTRKVEGTRAFSSARSGIIAEKRVYIEVLPQ